MAANPFDQFDAPAPKAKGKGNPFDQFDAPAAPPVAAPAAPPSPLERAAARGLTQPLGVLETGANVASGMLAAPISGLAGLATAGARAFGLTDREPADVVRGVGDALTYQPRTVAGQEGAAIVAYPFAKLAEGADWAGQQVADLTGSPAAGAAVNTAIQAAPAAIAPAVGRIRANAATLPKPTLRPRGPQPPPVPTAEQAATLAAEGNAKAYAAANGIDWAGLSPAIQARLTAVSGDARNLAGIDAAALRRQVSLESLPRPVTATRGQLTRDPVQLRNEGNASATEAGRPIREVYVEQNRALLDNLEILRGRQGGKAATPEEVGRTVQESARAKLKEKQAEVKDLYQQADKAGETRQPVDVTPIRELIANTPDVTHYGWVESWLNKTKADQRGGQYTIRELEDLRQAAVARAMNGGTEGYYAGKLISEIDSATAGAGGALYAKARKARREQAMEFDEQGGVAKLVTDKSRTDRAVALEDTWRKTVIGGSIDDLRNVKATLLTKGEGKARFEGRQAWKDLRAQTLQHIVNEATKSVSRFEDGTPNVTPAAMERAIKSIGPDKLNEIFGPGTVKMLDRIMQATRDVKTEPPPGFKGSPTFANVVAFLERNLNKIPGGPVITGAVEGVAKLNAMGKSAAEIRAAQSGPLSAAEEAAARNALAKSRGAGVRNALTKIGPLAPQAERNR